MGTHLGNDGKLKIGANFMAELKEIQLTVNATTVDDTVMGDAWDTHLIGTKNWSGSANAQWDETDANGQEVLVAGASVSLGVYLEGADSGDTYYTGTATVEQVTFSSSLNGVITRGFTFKGNGALTGPSTL